MLVLAKEDPYELFDDLYQLGTLIIQALQVRLNRRDWTSDQINCWLGIATTVCHGTCIAIQKVVQALKENEHLLLVQAQENELA